MFSSSPSIKVVQSPRLLFCLMISLLCVGGVHAASKADSSSAQPAHQNRIATPGSAEARQYQDHVQPLLEKRCVVCHGCYDAPCQLKLSSPEGIDRGASKAEVYKGSRMKAAPLTRLFEDAQSTAEWRSKGFYPVLNEGAQSSQDNLDGSVMHRLLTLKRQHPLPTAILLDNTFDVSLDRKQTCPKLDEFDKFAAKTPLWGMPYALPGLTNTEFSTLEKWLGQGASMAAKPPLSGATTAQITRWEKFLNGDSLKQQLASRYFYEHWFLAHLYFPDLHDGEYFKLVRSSTPPGKAIDIIATRRPYDDPGVDRVYYRFSRELATILDKTHQPYALDDARLNRLKKRFVEADYSLDALPSYAVDVAANPFIAFTALPIASRYRFLLENAEFTIMNFIKGPVCRGQVALNVIRDHFWVFFVNPEMVAGENERELIESQEANLRMPIQSGSSAPPLHTWKKYAKSQQKFLAAKSATLNKAFPGGENLTLDLVWDGGGNNENAALTVFRHFDSASVVKGLVGQHPQTAWIVGFSQLERIHYLLVAGFDVFGNLGHQMTVRLYMDFLRMEGESNFLSLLPPEVRLSERAEWYSGASKKDQSYLFGSHSEFDQPSGITYKTDTQKLELYGMLEEKLKPVLGDTYSLARASVPPAHRKALEELQSIKGIPASKLSQLVFLSVHGPDREYHYTVIANTAHSNITGMMHESKELMPEKDGVTVVPGFIGSYPSAYWRVQEQQLPTLVKRIAGLKDEASYYKLMSSYGVRRTAPEFWRYSDRIMEAHYRANPIENGLLDYNRLENR